MDEARVWNYARSAQQISRGAQLEIASAPGLRGRWGLNEGSGTVVADSSGNNINGTLVGSNVTWVAGAPFSGDQRGAGRRERRGDDAGRHRGHDRGARRTTPIADGDSLTVTSVSVARARDGDPSTRTGP